MVFRSSTATPTSAVPRWAKRYLSDRDVTVLEQFIAESEKLTDGEIVMAIARRSGSVTLIPLVLFLVFVVFVQELHHLLGLAIWMDGALLTLGAFGAWWLGKWPSLQRLFLAPRELERQVARAAAAEFLDARISHTMAATGVLIYVSLMERRVLVIGDAAISEKLSQSDWDGMVDEIVRGIKSRDFSGGLQRAITKAGALLAQHFAKTPGNLNELHNGIRFVDQ